MEFSLNVVEDAFLKFIILVSAAKTRVDVQRNQDSPAWQ
jgi:hypothetical protein